MTNDDNRPMGGAPTYPAAGISTAAPDGTILEVNDAFARMLGYGPEELVGKNFLDLTHPDDQAGSLARVRAGASAGSSEFRKRYLAKDGSHVWCTVTSSVILDDAGNLLYFVAHVREDASIQRLHERIDKLEAEVTRARTDEQRRLSRHLHETAAQTLATAVLTVELLRRKSRSAPQELRELIEEVTGHLRQASAELRTMAHAYYPPTLDEAGLHAALSSYVERFAERSGIAIAADLQLGPERASPRLELTIFRILQEALTNVHRHAKATRASVELERLGDRVFLRVRDNGVGISPEVVDPMGVPSVKAGVGLASVLDRISHHRGVLEIQRANPGTVLAAMLPWEGQER